MQFREASEKEDFMKCWEVMQLLRPQLNLDRYLTLMLYMLDEGYRLIYLEESGKVVSICGYRYTTMLDRGRSISIDDLCTRPEDRGKGYATLLLNHVLDEATEEEMQGIYAGMAFNRYEAQKMFIMKGFKMTGHVLSLTAK